MKVAYQSTGLSCKNTGRDLEQPLAEFTVQALRCLPEDHHEHVESLLERFRLATRATQAGRCRSRMGPLHRLALEAEMVETSLNSCLPTGCPALQWGHCLSAVETRLSRLSHHRLRPASMGPLPFSSGNCHPESEDAPRADASMGPLPFSSGNRTRRR